MATDQDKLLSAIRELVQQGSNIPSDTDLAAFVDLVRADKHGEALLSSLLEAKEVSSTCESFDEKLEDWRVKFKEQTPAFAVLFGTLAGAWLKVTALDIRKEAQGKAAVWPATVIPQVKAVYVELSFSHQTFHSVDLADTRSSGTLYYNTVEELNGSCDVTVNCSVRHPLVRQSEWIAL
jgi:hypothetical protein